MISRILIEDEAHPNPYAPPSAIADVSQVDQQTEFRRGRKKGPALYIVLCGLLGGMFGAPLLETRNAIAFVFPIFGCVAGGLLYRARSRHWPIDPTVRLRQLRYMAAVMTLIPGTIFLFSGTIEAQDAAVVMIGAIVGLAVCCGILASGTRRDNQAS